MTNTFKYSMPDIGRAVERIAFKDESAKFNYVMRIVENNINTVYIRMKNVEKAKEEAIRTSAVESVYKEVQYKPKKQTVKADKFSDLW